MTKQICKFTCLAFIAVTLFGCSSKTGDEKTGNGNGKAAAKSQATPQETYNNLKNAAENDNWSEALLYVTPDSQHIMLGGMIFVSTMVVGFSEDKAKQESFEKLLKQHGVNVDDKSSPATLDDIEEVMKALVGNVKDKGACLSALMDWMKKNMADKAGQLTEPITKIEIGEVKIDGDTATATITVDGKPDDPTIFAKIDGKWYIDILASEKAKKSGK